MSRDDAFARRRTTSHVTPSVAAAFALILGAFGVLGVAGGNAIAASVVLLLAAGISMAAYWRRRPV